MAKQKKTSPDGNVAAEREKKEGTWIGRAFKRYFITAMSYMALGLFSSLIIGLIIDQLSQISFLYWLQPFAEMAKSGPVVGGAIGVAIAYSLKTKPLVIFASAATGALGYALGGPIGSFFAAVIGAEIGNLIAGKTPVDIVLVPLVTIIVGGLVGTFIGPPINSAMKALGDFINTTTQLHPVPMGIIVSTVMGLALTAPISSAAISISIGLEGLAAGAACVGCCAQMVGFAVASYRENKVGGLIAQGLGTSMLQFGNIMRRPAIWLAPTLASAILGPISTAVFGMVNNAAGAGMGTSGLVGQINAWACMGGTMPTWEAIGLILLMHFILPAALTLLFSELFRKIKWVRPGDMALELK